MEAVRVCIECGRKFQAWLDESGVRHRRQCPDHDRQSLRARREARRRYKHRLRWGRSAAQAKYRDTDIFERDGWICGLCEGPIEIALPRTDPMGASIDHIVPVSLGGDDSAANVQAAHLTCNIHRRTRSIEAFRMALVS